MKELSDIQQKKLSKLQEADPKLKVRIDPKSKTIAHIRGKLSDPVDKSVSKEMAIQIGKEFLQNYNDLFGFIDMENDLDEDKHVIDDARRYHISFQQKHKNVPVHGGSIRIHLSEKGDITTISSKLIPNLSLSVKPEITDEEAVEIAIKHSGEKSKMVENTEPELIIYPRETNNILTWKVKLEGISEQEPQAWIYFIDAINRNVIHRYNNLHFEACTGSGEGYYSGKNDINTFKRDKKRYILQDITRTNWGGPEIITNDLSGMSPSEDENNRWVNDRRPRRRNLNQGPEVDAHIYAGKIVDYFNEKHGCNSFNNQGSNITINVHFYYRDPDTGLGSPNYGFWYPPTQQVYLGDGDGIVHNYLCSDDWLAHELTHAYTEHMCELVYQGESGALNEAFSDCFAAFVTGDWLIFERTFLKGTAPAERNMQDPTNGGQYDPSDGFNSALDGHQPDHYNDRYTGNRDNGGVHINNGIINHAIYLMAEGGTHRSSRIAVECIGKDPIEKLLFDVIKNNRLSQTATFLEFREAMLDSCQDLFPGDNQILGSVSKAFDAVGINQP
ncbi:MAG: M4 family metallopeptidase [Promethearchaeota archaeon]